MELFNKKEVKTNATNFAKDQVKDQIQGAVEDKVADAVTEKTIEYAMEEGVSSVMPWWIMFMWWPIKQIALLITWPIRIMFKKKK